MKFVLIVISVFFTCFITAQTRDTLFLWQDKVPNETEPKHPAQRTENTNGDVIRLTNVTDPILTIFQPEKPNGSKAGIVICPGGGYKILAINKEGYEVAEWLNSLGYTAFVLEYRVPKNRQGALQDLQRAIKWVRSKTTSYNLDPQKIGVMGFSAGGHLSASASTNYQKDSYIKVDDIDEFPSRPNFSMLIYPAYLDKGDHKNLSPELNIDQHTPPFFIFGTIDDPHGNSPLVIAKALRDKKVPVELHMLPEGGHGYGLRKGNIAAETWPDLAENWLNRMVKSRELAKYERKLNFPKVEEIPNSLPEKKDVWVFLMAGQSNMAGRGFVEPQDTLSSNRILTTNKMDDIIFAKEPLHFYEPTMAGLDSGLSFAKNLLKDIPKNVSILLIPTAVGGSSINQWIGDSIHRDVKLLSNFKQKVTLAKKYGNIKGILWHQGESDANKKGILQYDKNLTILFNEFRNSVGNKRLPVLVGELGSYSKNHQSWMAINNVIKEHAKKDKYLYVIHTSDFNPKEDYLHFNTEAQRLLGERYAEAFIKTIKK